MPRIDQLLKLHEADPTDADLPYMIGLEYAKTDELEQAITWIDKTIAIDAYYSYAYFQKGKLLSELGKAKEAVDALEIGIAQATASGDEKAVNELHELKRSMS